MLQDSDKDGDGVGKPLTLPPLTKHPQCPTPGCDLLAFSPAAVRGSLLTPDTCKSKLANTFFDCTGGTEVTHAPAERGRNVCNQGSSKHRDGVSLQRCWLDESCIGAGLLPQVIHQALLPSLTFPLKTFGKDGTGIRPPGIHIGA